MTQFNYTKVRNKAATLLRKFGRPVEIVRPDGTRMKTYGVFTGKAAQDNTFSGSQLEQDAQEVLLAGNLKFAPDVGDTLTYSTFNYKITLVEEVSPGTVAVIYKVRVL